MHITQPPSKWDDQPRIVELPAGKRLWRVHDRCLGSRAFAPPADHEPRGTNRWDEGRFDSTTDDPFPTLYAAQSAEAAAAECLARSVSFSAAGYRSLPPTAITNRAVSALRSTRPLRLVALLNLDDLRRVAQDDWLITAEPRDYAVTQVWGRWLRVLAPEAQGLIWPSVLFPGICLMVLFGDRILGHCVEQDGPSIELDTAGGATWLSAVLKPWGIAASPSPADLPETDADGQVSPTLAQIQASEANKPTESSLPDFHIFFDANLDKVIKIVNAAVLDWELASDVTQEAMIIAYRNWDTVARHPNPVGYVVKTAKRIAVRVRVREVRQSLLSVDQRYDRDRFIIDQVDRADDRLMLEQAISQVSPEQVKVLLLHDYCGYTAREIAHLLDGIPVGTVKSRLRAARKELQMFLRSTFGGLGRFP